MLIFALLAACSGERAKDYGPAPVPDHQAVVSLAMDRVFDGRYHLASPSTYRFEAPVQDRVASWLFEPTEGRRQRAVGYVYGWRVDFHVTPHYAGYPPQPESHRMAFFAGGQLRGLFAEGTRNAPLELDRWSSDWVDLAWYAGRQAANVPQRP